MSTLRNREELLRRLAEGWIDTGLFGTGLSTSAYTTEHRQAIMGSGSV